MKNQQKKPPLEDDTSDFPCDIIRNILSRLPVKSLLRCNTVCKSWNVTINDSEFTRIHSKQLNISDSHCFYATGLSVDGTYSLIKFEGHEFYEQSVVRCPSKEFEYPNFLCCCEGILLFKYSHRKTSDEYVLWNPFTRNYSTFSFPIDHDIIYGPGYSVSYGLCFDKYEDDYKVIVVSRGSNYFVYSIKNASWTERQSEFNGYVDFEGVDVAGVVDWTVGQEWSCRYTIIYFDPRDNLLKELHKPTDLEHKSSFFFVTNLRGNLCCFTSELEMIRIWLLKESGDCKRWIKLMTANYSELPAVCHMGMFRTFQVHRPMYLTSNNEVVFQNFDGIRYAFYCLEKQKFGEVKEFPACCMMIRSTCLESLNFPATRKQG